MTVSRIDKVLEWINTDHLTKKRKIWIIKSLCKICCCVPFGKWSATVTNIYKQEIQLQKSTISVYVKQYRLPQAQKVHWHIQDVLDNDIIEEVIDLCGPRRF